MIFFFEKSQILFLTQNFFILTSPLTKIFSISVYCPINSICCTVLIVQSLVREIVTRIAVVIFMNQQSQSMYACILKVLYVCMSDGEIEEGCIFMINAVFGFCNVYLTNNFVLITIDKYRNFFSLSVLSK